MLCRNNTDRLASTRLSKSSNKKSYISLTDPGVSLTYPSYLRILTSSRKIALSESTSFGSY